MVEVLQTRLIDEVTPRFRRLYEAKQLEKLLIPQPHEVADEILRRIQSNTEGTVSAIYSLSMYSGKTTAAVDFAYKARSNGMHVFGVQPSLLRFGKQQESQIMTHQQLEYLTFPAVLTDTNLKSVLKIAEEEKEKVEIDRLVLIIDEAMFYFDHDQNPQEAEDYIEQIRMMGIDIILTGITRTYQTTPFIVMDHLVTASARNNLWSATQMTTQCAFCPERATGTARYVIENGDIRLASVKEPPVKPGGTDLYLQVCVDKHPSFAG